MSKFRVESDSESDTRLVARKLGQKLRGGELIELVGDVGSGKTAFVKGLAEGLDSKDEVTSPTFVLENVYNGRLELRHLDLYRLSKPGLIVHEIAEARSDPGAVVVIEWAGIAEDVLPPDRIIIKFSVTGEQARSLEVIT